MKKLSVTAFCLFVIAITAYGFIQPGYHLQQLINLDNGYALLRILAAVVLAIYMFIPRVRTDAVKQLLRVLGMMFLGFGAITFISPTFMGSFWNYVPLGDVFIGTEAGVLALLLSIQLPAGQPSLIHPDWSAIKSHLTPQPQKLLPAVTRSKAKTANA